ncbi:Mu-like prophage major head subunit gpT family protein [Desulfotruncus alcoholivorax]|uniref:Mu-like prophage major head subunit gpT family protein n=1 Tax=Desulfotruncus alcoholivorax TaxID=265477 RepID=UPI0004035837|nr:Mu-like prophage major head subunit gpT family protein [Desulfotruncus alcoholivorax]
MIVNQAALQSVYRGFKVIFNQAFTNAKPMFQQVATVVPSSTKSEEYKWLGKVPRMREWIGDRVIQNLSAYGFTIKNKPFEATVSVDREDIEDDTIGLYSPMIQALGESAAMHPDELIFDLLINGFTHLCYDGQYFFDEDHKDGNGPVQSNKGTAALSLDSYAAARAQMMTLKDDQGKPLNIMPNLLVVSPQNDKTGREILLAERTAAGATNVMRGTAELLVVPALAALPAAWFLMDTSKPVKPLIFQRRKNPEFTSMDKPNDENVFMRKEFLYGVDSRDNAGYGLWQLAYGSTGAA